MSGRTFIGIVLALTVGASAAGAAAPRVTGLVTAVADGSVQMTTISKETTTISVDEKTGYMKWITHQPWQQDTWATRRSVTVGSCVDIEIRAGEGSIAKIVRINTDG